MSSTLSLQDLKLTNEEVVIDYDNYKEPTDFPPPVPAGIYTLKQGWQDEKKPFEASKDGFLQATLKHTVFDETGHEIGTIAFDRISNKPFERQGVKVNMMVDQLRALGNTDRPRTHDDYATAIAAGDGQAFKAQIDWEAFCGHKGTQHEVTDSKQGFTVKGMKRFPPLPVNGTGKQEHAPEIQCGVCGQTLQARARITRRIPKQ
jgi:hypothetical protein